MVSLIPPEKVLLDNINPGKLRSGPEVPALPAFMLQRAVSSSIRDKGRDYWTGTVYTTNRRIWEHDDAFKEYLTKRDCEYIHSRVHIAYND